MRFPERALPDWSRGPRTVNLHPDRRPFAINVVIPTHVLSCAMSSMADASPTDAQIGPYVQALEAIIYDHLMETTDTGPCLDKYGDVKDEKTAAEMKALVDARDSVMKVVENSKGDFLKRNPAFFKTNRKIIRVLMGQAPRTSDGVTVEDDTLIVKGVCTYPTDDAHILHAWWYVRVAPDLLLETATPETLDDVPVKEVARNWFTAIKAVHNYQGTSE